MPKYFLKTPEIAATEASQQMSRVKRQTKANIDLHDSDLKLNIFNKTSTSKPLLILNINLCRRLTEIKLSSLVIIEAGNAVYGVV